MAISQSSAPIMLDAPTTAPLSELKFRAADGLQRELRRRVDQYFSVTGLSERNCPRMYLKTGLVLLWCAISYAALVWLAGPWWVALPLAVSLGLSMAAIGFNVQHDGGHNAYSDRPWVNRLMAMSLDLLGGSSYVWARKHNTIHHSFANITGHDDDINIGILGRLTPHQPRWWFHRLQHFYLWVLYGMLPTKWQFYDDFNNVATARIGDHRIARPAGWDLVTFVAGKVAFVTFAFVIPLSLHSISGVLLCYVVASFVQGVALSVVFQLAHCVEDASFPMPNSVSGRMDNNWAVHQVESTVDFARGSRLLSALFGGLNFQIEHHLFPRICHIHYPALAPIVEQTCGEFGVRYVAHETFSAGLFSHYRWLRRMGQAPLDNVPDEASSDPQISAAPIAIGDDCPLEPLHS